MNSIIPVEPPRELIMPHAWDQGMLILSASILTICLLVSLHHLFFRRDPLMLLCLIGGGIGLIMEPICNVLAMAYHPEAGQIEGVQLLGRGIPLWVVLLYPWYFGGPITYLLIRWAQRGDLTPSNYWKMCAGNIMICFFFEIAPYQAGVWNYYGPQPYRIFDLPFLWFVVNGTTNIATAAVCALVIQNREGWQNWPIVVLMPISIVGVHTGLFAPSVMSVQAGWPVLQTALTTGLATIVFSAVLLAMLLRLLLSMKAVSRDVATAGSIGDRLGEPAAETPASR